MWILPEEEIDHVLTDGIAAIRQAFADNAIDSFLADVLGNVAERKRAEFRNLLKTTVPKIVHGWPHEQETLPCWAIVIRAGHNTQYVGDGMHFVDIPDVVLVEQNVVRWDSQLAVVSLSENGDVSRYLNQIVKYLLDTAKEDLAAQFLEQNVSEEDLGPPQQYAGRIVWPRQTVLSVAYHQRTDHPAPVVSDTDTNTEAHDAFL